MRTIAHIFATLAAAALAFACENLERANRGSKPERTKGENLQLDVDPMMRGTVASESIVSGFTPVVVRGYGLVVGLNGKGSRVAPAEVRAWMLREMARRGIGNPVTSPGSPSPEEMLNSEDCAIVVVEGIIPPAAPEEMTFDLRVYAAPGTGTTSLEGGRLYTTDLRPGPLTAGSKQASAIARGKGPIIINPFADPTGATTDTVNRLSGRIIGGGTVDKDMQVRLRLATPSHARARLLAGAINSTFPREPGQKESTAVGTTSELIDIHIPPSWNKRPEQFVELLRHAPTDPSSPEATALAINRSLINNPGASGAASWRWQAIGKKALPTVQQLYTYPEEQPRFAALNAGAKLDDPEAVPYLISLATSGHGSNRTESISLLRRMGADPRIELALRPLLADENLDVRLAAYEALRDRGDPTVHTEDIDGKFFLDVVPEGPGLIYVTQSGIPRIVLFGAELDFKLPLTLRAWSGDFLLKGESGAKEVDVLYRPPGSQTPIVDSVPASLPRMVRFLGSTPSADRPHSGLGMTYSQVISALHEIWKAGLVQAGFKPEQDRLVAKITKLEPDTTDARPEFDPEPEVGAPPAEASGQARPPGVESAPSSSDTVPR